MDVSICDNCYGLTAPNSDMIARALFAYAFDYSAIVWWRELQLSQSYHLDIGSLGQK